MKLVETILLLITYSTILITIFVSIICYKKNIEKIENIAFCIALLMLISAISVTYVLGANDPPETTNIFILLSMILMGVTTPLSVLTERKHTVRPIWKKTLIGFSGALFVATCIAYFIDKLMYLETLITIFLAVLVVSSMILTIVTKPLNTFKHVEKTNRLFSIAFLILVPISLGLNYWGTNSEYTLKIGFLLPIVFTLLAVNKLIDDLQRLSLIKVNVAPIEQHFKNYDLTIREIDVARLLAKGKSYKQIADELFISLPTVKTHASNIYRKCSVTNRHALTILITN